MRLGDKIPVPELSAAQAARVQRRVVAVFGGGLEIRGGWFGGRLRLAIAGAAVAAVAVALALDVPETIGSRGAVLGAGDVVVTELATAGDAVTVRLGDATVTLAPETAASIIRSRHGVEVALERGRVDCEVDPIDGRAPFVVGAADVEVEVVGTVFAVERDGPVRVEVDRGKVRVRSPAGAVIVEAGRAWTAADGVISMVAELETELTFDERPAGENVETGGDQREAGDGDEGDAKAGPRNRSGDAPKARRGKAKRPAAEARDRRGRRPPRFRAPRGEPALLEAMALESSDPRAAIRAYTEIAATSRGRIASFALYSKAYVEHFKLGARAAAVETLDLFNRRFPRAREAQSALWLRVLGLCDLGRVGECRAAAYSYIRRFPEGTFVDAASLVVNQ